ncbi:MAG TPA: helix-turn-helix transcriptional regulator [Blastocatellia bacterium]|nr:helix-turn-helix transcriptional regulator [Blastocatellia bacterium]
MLAQGSYSSASAGSTPLIAGNERLHHLATALDEINEGAVFLNSDGQLLWHNRAFDKLLVDNPEGHLLVAAVMELGSDLHQNLRKSREAVRGRAEQTFAMNRGVTIGGIGHELHCTLMPKGMLGPELYLLCLVKRSASRWSSYEQHLRQTWSLTEREAQVAVECLQGKKNLEIAERLKISVETVNKHLDKVYQKAGVRGRAELASRLLDSGIL